VLLDILDDVFLLNFPLEPTESALNGFALLDFDFRHAPTPPSAGGTTKADARPREPNVLGYHR
jgi:hypothetical protein